MKAKRLNEVRALVAQPEFQAWWRALQRARADEEAARGKYDDLLAQTTLAEFRAELTQKNAIDTLYQAGECEDRAAALLFDATELENRSYRALADFEEQRFRASELWYRLGAAEKLRDEKRDAHARGPTKKTEAELAAAEAAFRRTSEDYSREDGQKSRRWEEVEGLWGKSAEVSLQVAEQRTRGKRIRRKAEALFALAEAKKLSGVELRGQADAASASSEEAQRRSEQLLAQAQEAFGCAAGADFLYFRLPESQKLAYCISLIEDPDSYNVEVRPLSLYSIDRQRGVQFLAPAQAEVPSAEEGDLRFEEYFLRGRKGPLRSVGA